MEERIVGGDAIKNKDHAHGAAMGYVVENGGVVTVVMDLSEAVGITVAFYLSKVNEMAMDPPMKHCDNRPRLQKYCVNLCLFLVMMHLLLCYRKILLFYISMYRVILILNNVTRTIFNSV